MEDEWVFYKYPFTTYFIVHMPCNRSTMSNFENIKDKNFICSKCDERVPDHIMLQFRLLNG